MIITQLAGIVAGVSRPRPFYTLSGATIQDSTTSRDAIAGVRVNPDGTVDKLINATYTQISVGTDWIIPNGFADADHDVRITNAVWTFPAAESFFFKSANEDAWVDLGTAREWIVKDTSSSPGGLKLVTFDIEIRDPAADTVATGSYTLDADYDIT